VLIARLTAQLRCYIPEQVDETWARLRHLGARREQLLTEVGSQVQQIRDLLECVWPAALATARQPFRSRTWIAALSVVVDRDGGDLARTRRLGAVRFEQAVRRQIIRRGGQKPCLRIATKLFAALTDPAGVTAHRAGALERVQLLLADWFHAHDRLAEVETRMIGVLDELALTGLVTSITGISPVGAAAILAQTGDPRRFATARALVKQPGWRRGRNYDEESCDEARLSGWAGRLPDRSGCHDHGRDLHQRRGPRRRGVDPRYPPRAGPRRHPPRHRRGLRPVPQRGAGRAGDRGPP
jgi:transposase